MTSAPTTPDDAPKFRYTGALAQEIELRWQDRWDADGTFETPNPAGPLADPGQDRRPAEEAVRARHVPVPVAAPACTSAIRSGFIGTDIYTRFKRMTGHNVHVHDGLRRLRPARRAVRRADRPAPGDHHQRQRRQLPPAAAPARAQPRPAAQRQHHRPGYYRWTQWIFLQIFNSWYDTEADQARPIDELVEQFASGDRADSRRPAVGRAVDGRAQHASSTSTAWPTSATRRSTGAPGSARSSPTKRSPPTVAATAATSRCSSATCASG